MVKRKKHLARRATLMYARTIGLLIGAALCGLFILWATDRSLPAEQGPLTISAVTDRYVVIRQSLVRHRSCGVQISASFLIAGRIEYQDVRDYQSNGMPGPDEWVYNVRIPPTLPSGPATLRIQKIWACSPFQNIWPIAWDATTDVVIPERKP